MKNRFIFGSWLLVAVLVSAGERVALWSEGKIPDFQAHQMAATTQEVKAPEIMVRATDSSTMCNCSFIIFLSLNYL